MHEPDEQARLIDDLRRRATEAEETLAAIHEGSVDAVMVRGRGQDEVFVIGDDVSAFRNFMEAMEPGAVAIDSAGRVLYANAGFRRIWGDEGETIQGRHVSELLPQPADEAVSRLTGETDGAGEPVTVTFVRDRVERSYLVSARPLHLGTVRGFAVTFADLTERVRREAAERAHHIASAIIASANEAMIVCDRTGVVTHANLAAQALSTAPLVGARLEATIPLTFPTVTGIVDIGQIVDVSLDGTAMRGIEAFAPESPGIREVLVSAAPLAIGDGEPDGCVLTLVDLTQRKKDERQMHLLMRELDHRVKNTLALVVSISKRTVANEETLEGFQRAFSGRIEALAATHNLLAGSSWESVSLRRIFAVEVSPYTDVGGNRVTISGADLSLQPRAAIALGLILHELVTNAAKHGALSNDVGTISLAIREKTKAPSVEVIWTERGGPPVSRVRKEGFGHTVIARSLAYSPNGGASLDLAPVGATCRIRIPVEDVV